MGIPPEVLHIIRGHADFDITKSDKYFNDIRELKVQDIRPTKRLTNKKTPIKSVFLWCQ